MNESPSSPLESAGTTTETTPNPLDVQLWYRRVYALCRARLISATDSEDATQEVFVRAISKVSQLRHESALGAWLRQITHHVCVDMIRRQQVRRTESIDIQSVSGESDLAETIEREQKEQLMKLINSLPESHREIVLLHYFEDMTYDEIAQWLGVARSTVNDRLSKARQMLRAGLAPTRNAQ